MDPILKLPVALLLVITFSAGIKAQPTTVSNNYKDEHGLPRLKTERAMIYAPGNKWLYNLHPSIVHFKN